MAANFLVANFEYFKVLYSNNNFGNRNINKEIFKHLIKEFFFLGLILEIDCLIMIYKEITHDQYEGNHEEGPYGLYQKVVHLDIHHVPLFPDTCSPADAQHLVVSSYVM